MTQTVLLVVYQLTMQEQASKELVNSFKKQCAESVVEGSDAGQSYENKHQPPPPMLPSQPRLLTSQAPIPFQTVYVM